VTAIREFLTQYRASLTRHVRALVERYRLVHIARKVVGVGSVGDPGMGRAADRPRPG